MRFTACAVSCLLSSAAFAADVNETPLAVKTSAERYPEVEAAIRARHPYELPEILAVPVCCGLAPYLRWVVDETGAPSPAS